MFNEFSVESIFISYHIRSVGACLCAKYRNTIDDNAETRKITSNHLW